MSARSDDIREAAINCHACDFCAAVHIDLFDENGVKFATASLPAQNWQPFIERFRNCMMEIRKRPHPAPARCQ
jgi:hypothetical protein